MLNSPGHGAEVPLSDGDLKRVRLAVRSVGEGAATFSTHTSTGVALLSPTTSRLLQSVLKTLAERERVTVGPIPTVLSSTDAAELLGVSRQKILRMARDEELESFRVGSHTRFLRDDVLALKERDEAMRAMVLRQIRDIEDQLDEPN